jgi:hypothetical protein
LFSATFSARAVYEIKSQKPKSDVLKLKGKWQDAVKQSLQKKKPPEGLAGSGCRFSLIRTVVAFPGGIYL